MSKPKINPLVWNTFKTLTLWSPLWIATTILFGAIGIGYSLFLKQDTWLATQAIVVRDDANRLFVRQNRVDGDAKTKAAQETFVELARNHQVVKNALIAIGPEPTLLGSKKEWPTATDIKETIDDVVSVHAPRGIDFGKTDVIYLDIKQSTPKRAIDLNLAVTSALRTHMNELRRNLATSVVEEMRRARDVARSELNKANQKLQAIEQETGSDLSDLRGLIERGGSFSSRTLHDQIVSEIRQAETGHRQLESDLKQLEQASKDPAAFLTAPNALFVEQPGLMRLREGLVDAQLSVSQLSGKLTNSHPTLVAARSTLDDIVLRLNDEFQAALASARRSFQISQEKLDRLVEQKNALEGRLAELAERRSAYESMLADVKTRTNIVQEVEVQLSDAESTLAMSESSSCFTLLDQPVISDRPVGPGRNTIIAASIASGFLFGIGLVFLIAPVDAGQRYGRRAIDSLGGGQLPIAIVPTAVPAATPTAPDSIAPATASDLIAMVRSTSDNGTPKDGKSISEKISVKVAAPVANQASATFEALQDHSASAVSFEQVAARKNSTVSVAENPLAVPETDLPRMEEPKTEPIEKLVLNNYEQRLAASIQELAGDMPLANSNAKSGTESTLESLPSPTENLIPPSSERRQRPRKAAPVPLPPISFGIRPSDTTNQPGTR